MKKVILLSAIAMSLTLFANAQDAAATQGKAAAKKEEIKKADAQKEHGQTTKTPNATSNAKAKARLAELKKGQTEKGTTTSPKSKEETAKAAADKKAELKAHDAQKESKAAKK